MKMEVVAFLPVIFTQHVLRTAVTFLLRWVVLQVAPDALKSLLPPMCFALQSDVD